MLSLFLILLIASCVKKKNCECQTSSASGSVQTEKHSVEGQTKDLAEAACMADSTTNMYFTKTCKIVK